ncbi:hypothetical protein AB0F43_33815 [Kribbella sp. NPDC023972]|uniref:hypothetical protein n=1 Tax=Kribbella sp. NPDC023972 TaxID=3154795 RepID=UPI0033FBFBFC
MPLDVPTFTKEFNRARDRIRGGQPVDIAAEQERLRAMVPADASEHDRSWTARVIASLSEPPPPAREWSELYHEAGRIHAAAYPVDGTVEEQITALQQARRRIWEIADRAPADEEADIRAMTRALEHLENELRDPSCPEQDE